MSPLKKIWSAAKSLALALPLGAAFPCHQAYALSASPTVATDRGVVEGEALDGYDRFLGIPFATPPVGPLRFQPPQPAAPWQGIRDATQFSKRCIQAPRGQTRDEFSEDCLYLNVFVPHQRVQPLPVMVEIYGGGFTIGAANDYNGDAIAKSGDVIVVTLNYRLGPFGFLALPELSAEGAQAGSGNYGLLDQQAALQWVHKNIAAFGGDPGNVTIFGESAGGMSVCAHLTARGSRGLFQRAISQSGFCGVKGTQPHDALERGAKFAKGVGCEPGPAVIACLRSKSADALQAGTSAMGVFYPVWDGLVLPPNEIGALRAGNFAHVPVIMGGTRDEASIFLVLLLGPKVGKMGDFGNLLVRWKTYGFHAPQVGRLYPSSPGLSPAEALSAALTDSEAACSTLAATRALATQTPTYSYEFAYNGPISRAPLPPTPGLRYGAAHSADVSFTFGHGLKGDQPGPDLTPEERQVSARVIAYWTNFARTGDPNGAMADGEKLLKWSRYDSSTDRSLVIDKPFSVDELWKRHHCDFWETSGVAGRALPH